MAKVEVVVKDTGIDPQGQTLPQRKRKNMSETEEAPKPKRRITIHGGSHFESNKPGHAQSQPRQQAMKPFLEVKLMMKKKKRKMMMEPLEKKLPLL